MQYLYLATSVAPPAFPLPTVPMMGMPTPPQLGPQAPGSFAQPLLPPFSPLRPMAQLSLLRPPMGMTVAAPPPVTSETPIPEILTSFQSPMSAFVS